MKKKAVKSRFVGKTQAKKTIPRTRRVNLQRHRQTKNVVGVQLRLPLDLELEVRQVALSKGDLSRIVLFAMERIDQRDVELIKTRKANVRLGRRMLLHLGAEARQYFRTWAEKEDASVNQVVISLLERFFALGKKDTRLREELDLELRALAKKTARGPRRGNREGQKWTKDRVGMTLRLPLDLEVAVKEVALSKGDLSRIVLFAMESIDQRDVELIKTRNADLGLGRPMLLHVGAAAREYLRAWAEKNEVSVNQVVISLLNGFFASRKKNARLREELDLELRALRGV